MALNERPCSASACWLAYLLAGVVAVCVSLWLDTSWPWLQSHPLWHALAVDVAATLVVYMFSLACSNSSLYDPYWCVAAVCLCLHWKARSSDGLALWHPRTVLLFMVVLTWAIRFVVLVPWEGWTHGLRHEDWRYHDIRTKLGGGAAYWAVSLTSLHVTPTLLVFGALAPAGAVLSADSADLAPLGVADFAALALAVLAIVIEGVADAQLRQYTRSPGHAGKACRVGLWRYSRHPNYFGECLFWSSVLAMAAPSGVLHDNEWLCCGAVAMWAFFRTLSVPLMDARSSQRRSDWAEVMASTSALVLWPPQRSKVE